MSGFDATTWETFALGHLGASAALLGLVFVGISINLRELVTDRRLVNRAAEAVLLLGGLLAASTVILIPAQTARAVGIELVAVGALTLLAVVLLGVMPRVDAGEGVTEERPESAGPPPGSSVVRRILAGGAAALVIVAGISLIAGSGGGLYWWPAAALLAYLGAITNSWVLLVEILR